tara:strand:- start:4699 stop:5727 length:1029 start_codon:yes stop_codon:yes gene_type:complete
MKSIITFTALILPLSLSAQLPSFPTNIYWNQLDAKTETNNLFKIRIEYYEVKDDSTSFRSISPVHEYIFSHGKIDSIHFINTQTDSIFRTFILDDFQRVKEERIYLKSAWEPIVNYQYNDIENTSSKETFLQDSSLHMRVKIKYDSQNQPLKMEEYKKDSILTRYWLYEYDSCQNLTKKLMVNTPNGPGITAFGNSFEPWPNDTTTYQNTYKQGCKQLKKLEFHNSSLQESTEYFFSGDTAITKTFEYSYGGEISVVKTIKEASSIKITSTEYLNYSPSLFQYTYFNNIPISYTHTSSGELVKELNYTTNYIKDSRGNWVERNFYENGVLTKKAKRIIWYNQ